MKFYLWEPSQSKCISCQPMAIFISSRPLWLGPCIGHGKKTRVTEQSATEIMSEQLKIGHEATTI